MKSRLIWGVAVLSAGCALNTEFDSDASETGTSHEQLVGGAVQPNTTRPEIGQHRVPIPTGVASCTATLIGPRYALTAAHCLRPQYTGTTVINGQEFRVWNATTGTWQASSVQRVQSWAAYRYELSGVSPNATTDVALVRLQGIIPNNIAVPATLAPEPPHSADAATIWGFGCTARTTPPTGGGAKQSFDFTFPDATRALCPGDSGGPVFSQIQGRPSQWGVNSDYTGVPGDWPNWTDLFGDVPYLKYQIELVMRQWDTSSLQLEFDRPGLDYRRFDMETASPQLCQAECQKDTQCRAFTYLKPGMEGARARCNLKMGVPDWVPRSGAVSGLPLYHDAKVLRSGSNYREFDLAASRPELCYAECAIDPQCQAYTYRPATANAPNAHCWLKNAVPEAEESTLYTTGVRRAFEVGVNRPAVVAGDDYLTSIPPDGQPETCARQCAGDENCRAFTFVHPTLAGNTGECRFKRWALAARQDVGFVSGVKRGFEINTNRPGDTYHSFSPQFPRPEICQAACVNQPDCRSWTYVPATVVPLNGRCELKRTVRAPVRSQRYVSGIRGTEFFGGEPL